MKKPILLQLSNDRLISLHHIDQFVKNENETVDVYFSGIDYPTVTLSNEEYIMLLEQFEVINLYDETHSEQTSLNFKEQA